MKFSENWLRQHVPTDATRERLAEVLTAIGLEVEDVTALGESLDGVVVARIVSAEKHPEADRLQVCQVDAGGDAPLQIVCGAPNARPGLIAPLATVGTKMGEITIKAAKLRGVESNGMLCSAKELGLDADASGLFELPEDAPIGAALADYLGLPDASIEIKLTPNRADCFSVRGIAFDVAAATGSEVVPLSASAAPVSSDASMAVNLQAGADAPRYCGRVIERVDGSVRTPLWMAERLRRSGIRPVSFLVDVTQYVMLELGQPMHAFDRDLLSGPMGVRHARAGETLTLLDSRETTLSEEFLVVTDADRVVALAGIMGGLDTRVTEVTKNVFLEAAHFAPSAIIGRSRKLGLHTDAAHRFERGVDPELPRIAIETATRLILDIAGGAAGPVIEAALDEHVPTPAHIHLRRTRLVRVLGIEVPAHEVTRILRALGLDVAAVEDGWQVLAPPRRFDLSIEEDLIEEIARIHGYERIPLTAPTGEIRLPALPETLIDAAQMRQQMAARGYFEAVDFAFLDAALLETWQLGTGSVPLANPLSAELGVMRTALLPGLVDTLRRNLARQQTRVRLFEIGRVFTAAEQDEAPIETLRIAAAACGSAAAEQWTSKRRDTDFYDLKGDLESLRALAGNADLEMVPSDAPWLHPGRSAAVMLEGQRIGWIGQLHPRLLKRLDIDEDVIVFEVDLAPLSRRKLPRATAISRFPSVRRDLAVVVAESTPWSALENSLNRALDGRLRSLTVFDRYTGPGLETGFKSVAIGLILQDASRTLTDEDADKAVADALAALSRDCDAKLRA